jgi:hypothetical protein
MITLGGVTLSNDMYLEPAHNWVGVVASVERSVGGGLIIWENSIEGGEPLDLVSTENMGWMTYATFMEIKALAAVARAPYSLVYRTETFTVRFRHEDAPALEVSPIIPRKEMTNDAYSYFYGKIKLFCL